LSLTDGLLDWTTIFIFPNFFEKILLCNSTNGSLDLSTHFLVPKDLPSIALGVNLTTIFFFNFFQNFFFQGMVPKIWGAFLSAKGPFSYLGFLSEGLYFFCKGHFEPMEGTSPKSPSLVLKDSLFILWYIFGTKSSRRLFDLRSHFLMPKHSPLFFLVCH